MDRIEFDTTDYTNAHSFTQRVAAWNKRVMQEQIEAFDIEALTLSLWWC